MKRKLLIRLKFTELDRDSAILSDIGEVDLNVTNGYDNETPSVKKWALGLLKSKKREN